MMQRKAPRSGCWLYLCHVWTSCKAAVREGGRALPSTQPLVRCLPNIGTGYNGEHWKRRQTACYQRCSIQYVYSWAWWWEGWGDYCEFKVSLATLCRGSRVLFCFVVKAQREPLEGKGDKSKGAGRELASSWGPQGEHSTLSDLLLLINCLSVCLSLRLNWKKLEN